MAARWPKPAFDISAVQRFDPPMSRATGAIAAGLFGVLLTGTAGLLWNAHLLGPAQLAAGAAAVVAGLWGVGALCAAHA